MAKSIHAILRGGGAAGCFEAGALLALEENGVLIRRLHGASAGALCAAGFSWGGGESLREAFFSIGSESDVFASGFPPWVRAAYEPGIKRADPLRRIVQRLFETRRHPIVPFDVAVYDLWSLSGIVVDCYDKDIVNMVVASCSIPGYVEPYLVPPHAYCDGGLTENTPLGAAVAQGCDLALVISGLPTNERFDPTWAPGSTLHNLVRAYVAMRGELARDDLRVTSPRTAIPKVLYIEPYKTVVDILDFDPMKIRYGFDLGYQVAMEVILKNRKELNP